LDVIGEIGQDGDDDSENLDKGGDENIKEAFKDEPTTITEIIDGVGSVRANKNTGKGEDVRAAFILRPIGVDLLFVFKDIINAIK
jgi:hypothetical protein